MKRLRCLLVFGGILFVAASATAGGQTEGGGNPWFNLNLVEHPWYLGVYGGYANNTLYQGGAEHIRAGKVWESGHGWTVGIPARYQIFNWLAVQAEAVFITKNYGYYSHAPFNKPYNETTNSFVEFPLLASLSVNPAGITGLRLYINGGGFLGVWAASHEKGEILDSTDIVIYKYDEDYEFEDRRDNRFEAGLAGGAGIQYDIRWLSVFAEWRYNYGLTDLQKQYQYDLPPQINDTWTVQLGILVNPGKIRGGK
jgi:hypothetical protein